MKRLFSLVLPLFLAVACNTGNETSVDNSFRPIVSAVRNIEYTGRGNCDETLVDLTVQVEHECLVTNVSVRLDADAHDISALKLRKGDRTVAKADVCDGKECYSFNCKLNVKDVDELQICADIKPEATEGGKVLATVESITFSGGTIVNPVNIGDKPREILLCRKKLFGPGDYGSKEYRIPALKQLSDGTLLAVNDRRNTSVEDLPGEIDVVYRLSTDHGQNWTEPQYIHKSNGFMDGCGDPAVAELLDGTIVCTFCGCETYSRSSVENPQRSYFCISKDHGRSWSEKTDITSQIWGPEANKEEMKYGYKSNFFSSGNSLVLTKGEHRGRLISVGVQCRVSDGKLSNHAIYTDDLKTWHVSEIACDGRGDEAKVVELLDGSILMSIRTRGKRLWTISRDSGETWDTIQEWADINTINCNGDLIRYNDEILLHSIPDAPSRRNVSVLMSFDEGKTWPERKTILYGTSQYSSLTVLDDGTIGAYVEENQYGVNLWYMNFSIDWLRRQDEKQAGPSATDAVQLWEGGPFWADRNLGAVTAEAAGMYLTMNDGSMEKALGEVWRLPSEEEFLALKSKCTWTWSRMNGQTGYKVEGNGGSIFIPASGYKSGNTRIKYVSGSGHYWCDNCEYYFNQQFNGSGFYRGKDNGLSVRPVLKKD